MQRKHKPSHATNIVNSVVINISVSAVVTAAALVALLYVLVRGALVRRPR